MTGYAWQENGTALAITVGVEGRTGNAIQVFDPKAGSLRVLDSGPAVFTALAWRKESNDLAALRSFKQDAYDGESYAVLAWKNLGETRTARVDAPRRIVSSRAPQWSDDGAEVYVGIAEWLKKLPGKKSDDDPATVEVWHWKDENVISEQKLTATRDRDRNTAGGLECRQRAGDAAHHECEGTGAPGQAWSDARSRWTERPIRTTGCSDASSPMCTRSIWRPARAALVAKHLIPPVDFSPGGRYALNFQDGHFQVYDLESGAAGDISKDAPAKFTNQENDYPVSQKPAYGIAGWTKNDRSVIVYDAYDLWELFPDGSQPRRLTDGSAEEIRHRYVRTTPLPGGGRGGRGGRGGGEDAEWIDLDKPVYLSLEGRWTKRTGYARLQNGKTERLVWTDQAVRGLEKAKNADTWCIRPESWNQSPNYFTAGAGSEESAEGQRHESVCRAVFVGPRGTDRLQEFAGRTPAGRAVLSGQLRARQAVSDDRADLRDHEHAVTRLDGAQRTDHLQRHGVDAERLLRVPAGYRLPSAGAGPFGAGLCDVGREEGAGERDDRRQAGRPGGPFVGRIRDDLSADADQYVRGRRGGRAADQSGVAVTARFTGIAADRRRITPRWDRSAWRFRCTKIRRRIFATPRCISRNKLSAPLLLSVGDQDGASDWHQDIELYNSARRAGKPVVMLVYEGENHSVAQKANQLDYHRRINAWFDHYLKDEAAPEWITQGVTRAGAGAGVEARREGEAGTRRKTWAPAIEQIAQVAESVLLPRKAKDFGSDLTQRVANAAGVHVEVLALRLTGLEDVVAACIDVILVVGDAGQPVGVERLLAVVVVQTDHEDDRVDIGILANHRGYVVGYVKRGVADRPRTAGVCSRAGERCQVRIC